MRGLRKLGRMFIWMVVCLTVLLPGCGENDESRERKRPADELILAIGGEPEDGFDPTAGWGRYGSPLFQSTLLKRDHRMNIGYDLAVGYEIGNDGMTWTVRLRDDVKFSDGEPLTASDVVYTFETAARSGSTIDLSVLSSVRAADDHTVVFELREPQSTFVSLLMSVGIVPEHAHDERYASNPIGSGPYKLVQWDRGQQLIVEVNPYYYGEKPAFRRLTFLFLSEDAALAAAKAGQADVAAIPTAYARQSVRGMRLVNIQTVDNRGIMFPYVPAGNVTDEGLPIGNDVTSRLAVRRAVNKAIDRQALVEGILEGYGKPAYTPNDELPWWNPETVFADGDAEEARKIMAEDGWEDADGDGVMERDGLRASFTLLYPSNDSTRQSLALTVAQMVKQAGIEVRVEGKSWAELARLMHANAVLFGWGSHDPLEMYMLYSSKYRGVDMFNAGYYSNPQVDAWMEKALRATDEDEANLYWRKAQWDGTAGFSYHGDAAWAWLVNIDHLYLVNEKLDIGQQGIHPHAHGWPITHNITEWRWLE